jgi:hypothetical protein
MLYSLVFRVRAASLLVDWHQSSVVIPSKRFLLVAVSIQKSNGVKG